MVYYLTIKRNKLLIHSTTWIDLKNMLCEKSQSQKVTYSMILFIWHSWNGTVIEMENRLVLARSWRRWVRVSLQRNIMRDLHSGGSVLYLDCQWWSHISTHVIRRYRTVNRHCANVHILTLILHYSYIIYNFNRELSGRHEDLSVLSLQLSVNL